MGKLILIIFLTALIIAVIVKAFSRKNREDSIGIIKEYSPSILRAFAILFSSVIAICASSFFEKTPERSEEDKAYDVPRSNINKKGEYCGQSKSNWY